jgi:hypothetical protein
MISVRVKVPSHQGAATLRERQVPRTSFHTWLGRGQCFGREASELGSDEQRHSYEI